MPYRPVRPVSIAAAWARFLGRLALALALAALVLHRFDLLSLPNMVAVLLLAAAVSLAVVGLAAIGFAMLWINGAKGGRAAFAGLVMALLVLGPVGYAASRYVLLPSLHDISTDLVDPPAYLREPAVTPSFLPRSARTGPEQRALQAAAYPELAGRRYDGAIDRVLEAVNAVAADRKWVLVAQEGADYLEPGVEPLDLEERALGSEGGAQVDGPVPVPAPRPALDAQEGTAVQPVVLLQYSIRSPVFGIRHDIAVRLAEEEQTTFVDMRASTRDGDHDLGLNARLIRGFLHDLDVRLLGIAGN